jgi:hypothetical protein
MAKTASRRTTLLDAAQAGLAAGALLQIPHVHELAAMSVSEPAQMFLLHIGWELVKLPLLFVIALLLFWGGSDL